MVRAERVEVGATRRLPGVVLVDARGADDGQPAQHVARGGAERDHREAARDTRLRAREPRLSSLLKPSTEHTWCWWATLLEMSSASVNVLVAVSKRCAPFTN